MQLPPPNGASDPAAGHLGKSLLQAALGAARRVGALPGQRPATIDEDVEATPEEDVVEEKSTVGWSLLRSAFSGGRPPLASFDEVEGASPASGWQVAQAEILASQANWPKTPGTWDRERAFEIADDLEGGTARETSTDFTTPLRRSGKLWRFRVVRSEDRLKYRMVTEQGAFLMYAQIFLKSRLVSFFLYDPGEEEDRALYDTALPTFSMTYNEEQTEWRLVQERCSNCRMAPSHLSCSKRGSQQQLAVIRHSRSEVGDGTCHCLDVWLPGVDLDGNAVVWCHMLGKSDLGGPENDDEKQFLVTRLPEWSDKVESLVLDFKGRQILSSAKNFQLAMEEKPNNTVCQYGKIGNQDFALDFKYPLSAIQAFGIAMTVFFWM